MGIISAITHKDHIDYNYQLFLKIKNKIGFLKSTQYMDWFHDKYNNKQPHHVFSSIGNLKTTDYCCVPVTLIEHRNIENIGEAQWAIDNLDLLFNTMIDYIRYLESTCPPSIQS